MGTLVFLQISYKFKMAPKYKLYWKKKSLWFLSPDWTLTDTRNCSDCQNNYFMDQIYIIKYICKNNQRRGDIEIKSLNIRLFY